MLIKPKQTNKETKQKQNKDKTKTKPAKAHAFHAKCSNMGEKHMALSQFKEHRSHIISNESHDVRFRPKSKLNDDTI